MEDIIMEAIMEVIIPGGITSDAIITGVTTATTDAIMAIIDVTMVITDAIMVTIDVIPAITDATTVIIKDRVSE